MLLDVENSVAMDRTSRIEYGRQDTHRTNRAIDRLLKVGLSRTQL